MSDKVTLSTFLSLFYQRWPSLNYPWGDFNEPHILDLLMSLDAHIELPFNEPNLEIAQGIRKSSISRDADENSTSRYVLCMLQVDCYSWTRIEHWQSMQARWRMKEDVTQATGVSITMLPNTIRHCARGIGPTFNGKYTGSFTLSPTSNIICPSTNFMWNFRSS